MKRMGFALLCAFISIMMGAVVAAQTTLTAVCESAVQAAFEAMSANCAQMGANSACYGAGEISVVLNGTEADFAAPGDVVELGAVTVLSAAGVNAEGQEWGLARLNVQANQPLAADPQTHNGLTYLLIGEATLENQVAPETAFLPVAGVPATALIPANVRQNPFENSTVLTSIAVGQPFTVDAVSPDGAWLRAVAPDGVVGWVSANIAAAEIAGLPVVTPQTRTPMQSFILRTGPAGVACAEAGTPAPMLIVQSPETLAGVIEVNGEEILIRSTIALRVLPGNLLQVITLSGAARAGNVVIPAGFSLELQLNETGDAAEAGALWSYLRPMNAEERTAVEPLEGLTAETLPYYALDIPTEAEVQAVLDAVGGTTATYGSTDNNNTTAQPGGSAADANTGTIIETSGGGGQPAPQPGQPNTPPQPGAPPVQPPPPPAPEPTARPRPCFSRDGRQC